MAALVEFYNRNTRQVTAAVDQTEYELRQNPSVFDQLFPSVSYQALELLLLKMKGNISVASVVAPDQELPNDAGQFQLNEQVLSRLLIGKQHIFVKEEYELFEKMQRYLADSGPQATAVVNATRKYLYGLAADMPMAIDAKALILLFQVLSNGSCDYLDPLTQLQVTLTYNDRVNALFPTALTGADRWSQGATATGLTDLEDLAEEWRNIHGVKPRWMFAHYNDLRNLADQTFTKNAYGSMSGTDSTLAASVYIGSNYNSTTFDLESGPLLDLIRSRTGVETVKVFDHKYTETLPNGVKRDAYFLPSQTIIFADPGGMYERARLPFVENGWQPGVYVRAKELNDAPLKERLAGLSAVVPFVRDGRYLCAQKIDGAA